MTVMTRTTFPSSGTAVEPPAEPPIGRPAWALPAPRPLAHPLPERAYRPLRMTLCVCGRCFSEEPGRAIDYERDILQGSLVSHGGAVWLRRRCRRGHGEVVSLYEEDLGLWESLQRWRVPTKELMPDDPAEDRPIPMGYERGLGALQDQHSCILLVDVTEHCDIACPTCFARSSPRHDRYARPDAILRSLDALIAREGGRADLVMLSGGEPTTHPAIEAIVDGVLARPVTRLVLNTNGIRVAHDDRLAGFLAARRDRLETYLQFDGVRPETYRRLRGADLAETKRAALATLTDARIFTTLACTVAAGVNDDELGAIVDLALATDHVGGIAFQPMFGVGAVDPLARATTTGTIRRLGEQCGGRLGPDDFIGLPCSHPDCSSLTYLVRLDDGTWRSVPSLVGVDTILEHLGLIGNRLIPDEAMWTALTSLLSETMLVGRADLLDHLGTLTDACGLGASGLVRVIGTAVLGHEAGGGALGRMGGLGAAVESRLRAAAVERASLRVKRITVKSFMDAWTLNVERLRQCCVHVATTDPDAAPVRIPFCARNVFGGLRERTIAGMAPRIAWD